MMLDREHPCCEHCQLVGAECSPHAGEHGLLLAPEVLLDLEQERAFTLHEGQPTRSQRAHLGQ